MTPAAQTSEPQTAAGRAVAAWSESDADLLDKYGFRTLRQAVLAIEAEAAAELDVERLWVAVMEGTDPDTGDVWLHREDADILRAALAREEAEA